MKHPAARSLVRLSALALCVMASTLSPGSDRVRMRFDANWRFRSDPIVRYNGPDFVWKWAAAEGVDMKVDSIPAELASESWIKAGSGEDVFKGQVGFVWYRTDLGKGKRPANLFVHFEGVDDNAAVFFNGKLLKKHEGWNEAFDVKIGQSWQPKGPNSLTVLVQNTAGPGGIQAPAWLDIPRPQKPVVEAGMSFDDRKWRTVHLPHDYVVEGKFDPHGDAGHGSLPVTTAWYRKSFVMPTEFKGKSIWIDFDGIYRNSTVYLNGHKLGNWPSGYAPSRYDLTNLAKPGSRNVIAVHVDPRQGEGWWYEGGGIYRHVWLNAANVIHVKPWGVFVRTDVSGVGRKAEPPADLTMTTSVANDSPVFRSCVVTSRVIDPTGQQVAIVSKSANVPAGGSSDVEQRATLAAATLWSIDSPRLYRVLTSISVKGVDVDEAQTTFGVRTIRFDKDRGFFLNGKPIKLKGTCNHQDHAGVGIALTDSLVDWRIRKLKEMGSNAYRCSHNPPAAELLDACDRLGMVVMDETRHLGNTQEAKTPKGTDVKDLSELETMILRDRNHPSVIMWSLFNEEGIEGIDDGWRIFSAEQDFVKKLDPTRLCTGASNWGWDSGIGPHEDLIGFNYGIQNYDRIHQMFPEKPLFGSETSSTVGTRGIYANDAVRGYVSAYDANKPGWGATAEEGWEPIARRPWMAGAFVWTGFDYKGEPTPYGWPCINSHFGIMDICGFPKDNFYYYQAWWGDKPIVHIAPHWNWPGKEGQPIDVQVFSEADQVELLLNGKSLGAKRMPLYEHVTWSVPYQPGVLEAKALRSGKVFATDQVYTTGAPAGLRIETTQPTLLADGEQTSVVMVKVIDAAGRVVPTASNEVSFSVTGAASVVGVGNGDPSSHEPDISSRRHAFNGCCMALIGRANHSGPITVRATAPGLKPATIILEGIGYFGGDF